MADAGADMDARINAPATQLAASATTEAAASREKQNVSFDVLEGLGESDVSMEEVDDDDVDVPMGESSRGGPGAAARGAATAQGCNDEAGQGQKGLGFRV